MIDPMEQKSARIEESSRTAMQPRWTQRLLIVLISLAVLGGFAMVIVYSFDRGKQIGASDQVPIIIAEKGPTRVKPDDPGGMKIPFRDKEVYGEFNPSEKIEKKAILLPPEEKISLKHSMPVSSNEESTKKGQNILVGQKPPQKGKVEQLWEKTTQKKPIPSPNGNAKDKTFHQMSDSTERISESGLNLQRSQTKKLENKISGLKPLTSAIPPKPVRQRKDNYNRKEQSKYRIQIASFRSKSSAKRAWLGILRGNKDLLGQLKASIVKAEVKNRGTWYRLQALPIKDLPTARAVCLELKKRKIGCLVVVR